MVASTRDAELETIISLVRGWVPVRAIGRELGLTGQAVHARLKAAGLSVGALRATRCSYCGTPVMAARRRPSERHVCGQEACVREAERAYRRRAAAERQRARCAHCGKEMRYFATEELARPRFCRRGPCAAAYIRWRRTGEIRRTISLPRAA